MGAVLAGTCAAGWAQANTAGVIQSVRGDVRIERAGQVIKADANTVVLASDTITTEPNSSVGITLSDNTRVAMGGRSRMQLEQYNFNSTSNEGNLIMRLFKGSLGTITGLISSKSSNQVEVRTKTATAGVRGTEFIVEVPEDAQ